MKAKHKNLIIVIVAIGGALIGTYLLGLIVSHLPGMG